MAKITISYPDSGLNIAISVKYRDTGITAFSGTMTEIDSTGVYKYDFTEIAQTDYIYVATVSGYSTISNVVYADPLLGKSGGGGGFNGLLKTDIENAKREIINKIEETKNIIDSKIDEIESQNDIAKEQIITTIEDIEKEISTEIKSVNKEIATDNVATRQLIRQKAKKQEEFIQKQLDKEEKTQKIIDDEIEEIEKALDIVDEEEIIKAIQQADSEHEQNIIDALNSL